MVTEDRWIPDGSAETVCWRSVRGEALSGSFGLMLREAGRRTETPSCILAFFTHGEGIDDFIGALQGKFPGVPILGGTAARTPEQDRGEVLPAGEDGALLLVYGGAAHAGGFGVHNRRVAEVTCEVEDRRVVRRIAGFPAAKYLAALRRTLDKPENDFESITLREPCGKNLHCHGGENGALIAGADVQSQPLTVVEIARTRAAEAIRSYMRQENALCIGCAGLKTMVEEPFTACRGSVGVFLFGEVTPYSDGVSRFGNLMMGRLIPGGGA